MTDLQDLENEILKLNAYFDEAPPPDTIAAVETDTMTQPPRNTTLSSIDSATARLNRTARKVKGKIAVSYKQDQLLDLKKRIKEHIEILNVICSARTL